jgi:hypothetical protein
MDYPNLKTWLAAEPSGSTPAQLYAAVQATVPVTIDIPIGSIEGYLRTRGLVHAMETWLAANPTSPVAAPVSELLGLIMSPHIATIETSSPAIAAAMSQFLAAIVSVGIFSTQNQTDLLAMSASSTTVAASIDCPELATMDIASFEQELLAAAKVL